MHPPAKLFTRKATLLTPPRQPLPPIQPGVHLIALGDRDDRFIRLIGEVWTWAIIDLACIGRIDRWASRGFGRLSRRLLF